MSIDSMRRPRARAVDQRITPSAPWRLGVLAPFAILRFCLALALVVALHACGTPTPPDVVKVSVRVEDPLHAPVAGAIFWVDGTEVGQSDATGELQLRLSRSANHRPSLRHACPPGHRTDAPRRELPLHGTGSTGLRLTVLCAPSERATPLVVLARAASTHGARKAARLPVLIDGQPTDLTDSNGVAHTMLLLRPGQPVEVSLDTREQPALRPRNPTRRFVPGAAPEILLFDQQFELAPKRAAARPARGATRARPYRLQ